MKSIVSSPLFGIFLSIITYAIGFYLNRKAKRNPLVNPLIISTALVIIILKVLRISYEDFNKGGSIITMLLAPATAVLAIPIYKNFELLKKNLMPVLIAAGVGAFTSISSIYLMCKWFGLNKEITAALLPKSVTMPIAVELSRQGGGFVPLTVAAVMFTGIAGQMFAPHFIKLFRLKHDIEKGVAIGTSSHAAGTSKAVELGETIGAMSGIAIGVAGIFTVIYTMFF